jgi:hypothetical protein
MGHPYDGNGIRVLQSVPIIGERWAGEKEKDEGETFHKN